MNRKRSARNAYIIMSVMAIVFILPLLWVIFASFNPDAGVGLKLPSTWVIENYQAVLSESKNVRSFGIGLALSIGVAALEVIVCALASYPLSRYELRYKKSFMYTILFMSCLPMTALMIPAYKLFVQLHLMDNILGVVLFMAATQLPYNMWMMKNFMDQVALEERLSNQVYHYDKDLRKLSLATDTPNKRLDGIVAEPPMVYETKQSR